MEQRNQLSQNYRKLKRHKKKKKKKKKKKYGQIVVEEEDDEMVADEEKLIGEENIAELEQEESENEDENGKIDEQDEVHDEGIKGDGQSDDERQENRDNDNEERGNDADEANNGEDNLTTDEELEEEEMDTEKTLFQGFNENAGMHVPLQHKNNLKAINHLLVILARGVRYNSTYEEIIDQLKWIKKSFQHINIPTKKQALWKVLGRDKSNLIRCLYCSKC